MTVRVLLQYFCFYCQHVTLVLQSWQSRRQNLDVMGLSVQVIAVGGAHGYCQQRRLLLRLQRQHGVEARRVRADDGADLKPYVGTPGLRRRATPLVSTIHVDIFTHTFTRLQFVHI
jgi:hypothetical protein